MPINYNDSDFFNKDTVGLTDVDGVYVVLTNVLAFSSILGSLAIVSCYLYYRDIRCPSRKLLLFLSIAVLFQGIAGILQNATYFKSLTLFDEDSVLCQAASFLSVYSRICVYLWTDTVSFYLLVCVSFRSIVIGNKVLNLFHFFCWIMPAIVAVAAVTSDVYGYDMTFVLSTQTPSWCWISDRVQNQLSWYYMTDEAWALFSIIFCFLAFCILTISVSRQSKRQRAMDENEVIEDMAIQTVNKHLRFIPAVFFSLRFWGSLYFLVGNIGPNKRQTNTMAFLLIMKGICDHSQGIANFIFFCFTTNKVRQHARKFWSNFCFNTCRIQQKPTFDGSFSAPRIFRVRGKYQKKRMNISDELDLSSVNLDLPTSDHTSMMEDEVVFERD